MADIIAFYLPQYHPTPHNDEWWGRGFTEWTNVGKAKPLFRGHYQPKVPADLGYYDLRLPQVREAQALLAQEAGVTGFCYYHYWFEKGKEELEMPFREVLKNGSPDFPFCLCWANESWHCKFWQNYGDVQKKLLVEQKYPGIEDHREHFLALLDAFKDKRYMKIDGKPIFMIYRPLDFPDIKNFMNLWQQMAIDNGLNGIYFVAYTLMADREYESIKQSGFDAVCSCRIGGFNKRLSLFDKARLWINMQLKRPRIYNYADVYPQLIDKIERTRDDVFPTLVPNWDHTPRSGSGGYLYHEATPELFEKHAVDVLEAVKNKSENRQVCFLKSWNEWGEGNYMEPDLRYGKGYIHALRKAMKCVFGY